MDTGSLRNSLLDQEEGMCVCAVLSHNQDVCNTASLQGSWDIKKEGAEGVWEPKVKEDQNKTASSGQARAAALINPQKLCLPVQDKDSWLSSMGWEGFWIFHSNWGFLDS